MKFKIHVKFIKWDCYYYNLYACICLLIYLYIYIYMYIYIINKLLHKVIIR
jgi:hypothetical protein